MSNAENLPVKVEKRGCPVGSNHRDAWKFDFDDIFMALSTSQKSLKRICDEKGYKYYAVYRQIQRDPKLKEMQKIAREYQADHIIQGIFDRIGEVYKKVNDLDYSFRHKNSLVNMARVEMDNLRWIASKFRPSVYGDRQEVVHDFEQIKEKLRDLFPVKTIE